MERCDVIEYAKLHMSDMVIHGSPNYEQLLQKMAEDFADAMSNGDIFKTLKNDDNNTIIDVELPF